MSQAVPLERALSLRALAPRQPARRRNATRRADSSSHLLLRARARAVLLRRSAGACVVIRLSTRALEVLLIACILAAWIAMLILR